jgi:hypothetical protein
MKDIRLRERDEALADYLHDRRKDDEADGYAKERA